MGKIYLGLDCGTTSIKCMAVDETGKRICTASRMNRTISARGGWMEQDPDSWLDPAAEAVRECAERAGGGSGGVGPFRPYELAGISGRKETAAVSCMTVGDSRCSKPGGKTDGNHGGACSCRGRATSRSPALSPQRSSG